MKRIVLIFIITFFFLSFTDNTEIVSCIYTIKAVSSQKKESLIIEYDFNQIKPDENTIFKDGSIAKVKGYFHITQILLPFQLNDKDGFYIIKPFSYVREKNPSIGWPSWFALDAVLINVGWVPADKIHNHNYLDFDYSDPILIEVIVKYKKNINLQSQNYSISILWDEIRKQQIENDEIKPVGAKMLPFYFELLDIE